MMSRAASLDYDRFMALTGLALCDYIGAWVDAGEPPLPPNFLDRLLPQLESLDEYHLVYAIQFGAAYAPDKFARVIPQYLAHPDGSVWSAATRALLSLPHISNEVYEDAQRHAARCRYDLSSFLDNLARRVR